MDTPALDQDDRFLEGVEDLPVEQFVPELAVEALIVTVLPWRSWFDVERLHTDPAQPVAPCMGCKLSAIVTADVIGRTVPLEQFGQYGQHIIALELALHMDRQALAAVLVDHGQHAERFAIVRTVHDEVVAPHMAGILRPEPNAGTVVKPQTHSLWLSLRYLEPFTSPYQLDPLGIEHPAFVAQQRRNPAIAIAAILLRQPDDRRHQRLLVGRRYGQLALGRAVLANDLAGTALGYIQHLLHLIDGQPTP